jgi:hypothetical protein
MDRVRIQVQFKKFIWLCPVCGLEDIVDAKMEGGNEYVHTCANGHSFNQSGPNMKEYNGTVNYTPEEYEKKTEEDVAVDKQKPCDDWLYSVKNPPAYVEPTKEDYQRMYEEKMAEAQVNLSLFAEKATEAELTILKTDAVAQVDAVVKVVEVREAPIDVEEIKG